MTKNKNKRLVFNSQQEIDAYALKLKERLEDIDLRSKATNAEVKWWSKEMDSLISQLDKIEESNSDDENVEPLISRIQSMSHKGREEHNILIELENEINSYLNDSKEFRRACEAYLKRSKNGRKTK